MGNLHLKAIANGDAIDLAGSSAFVDVVNIHGGHPSRLVGDAQGTTKIEGRAGTQVEELSFHAASAKGSQRSVRNTRRSASPTIELLA